MRKTKKDVKKYRFLIEKESVTEKVKLPIYTKAINLILQNI